MAKKADKKKTSKSYKKDNPMRPDKKEGRGKNYRSANPYLKSKGKKASKKTGK